MYTFSSSNLETITIHDTIEEIGTFSFHLSNNLKTVYIGKNVKIMEANPFVHTKSLTTITIDKENKYFKFGKWSVNGYK